MPKIGAHMSIAKGLESAVKSSLKIQADTMQIFSRNPRGSTYKNYSEKEIEDFLHCCEVNEFGLILAHAPYTMNLAASKPEVYEFGCQVIREELKRMEALKIPNLVFHPGSHTGSGKKAGIKRIVKALDQAIDPDQKIMVLLETMSGKGTEIGSAFEELREIKESVRYPEKIGICLDTCHVFAAGYDLVHDLDGVLEEFDRVIGLSWLRGIHFNDSLEPFGSHKDRHAVIGGGRIGAETMERIFTHPLLQRLPFYLETPLDDAGHGEEIRRLRAHDVKTRKPC